MHEAGQCSGTTQRDKVKGEVGGGFGMRGDTCTHGCFKSIYGKNHHTHCKVIILQLNK